MSGRRISFVFGNPRHHLEMMRPVMVELARRGTPSTAVSLAELRGYRTPAIAEAAAVRRVIPAQVRRDPTAGASLGGAGENGRGRMVRRALQQAIWHGGVGARLRHLVGKSDAVVMPNDAAFPYRELADMLRARGVPFLLVQEGVRFPLPGVSQEDAYGRGGATVVCAWGEASADYFRGQGVPSETIAVTGNPRFDELDIDTWRERGRALMGELGLTRPPLLFLSNPIDDQGFCTTAEKLALFQGFADEVAPLLEAEGRSLVVKLHPREDAAAFREAASRSRAAGRALVLGDAPLFAALAAAGAAVVLTSTVGLEALLFGVPLGALEIPRAGFAFDYVSSRAAVGLRIDPDLPARVAELLARTPGQAPEPVRTYLERQLAHRGHAAQRLADQIERVAGRQEKERSAAASNGARTAVARAAGKVKAAMDGMISRTTRRRPHA